MAFNFSNLSLFSQPMQPERIWTYDTSDTVSDVESVITDGFDTIPAYLIDSLQAYTTFRTGDFLAVTASDGKALYRIRGIGELNSHLFVQLTKVADVTNFVFA